MIVYCLYLNKKNYFKISLTFCFYFLSLEIVSSQTYIVLLLSCFCSPLLFLLSPLNCFFAFLICFLQANTTWFSSLQLNNTMLTVMQLNTINIFSFFFSSLLCDLYVIYKVYMHLIFLLKLDVKIS